MRCELSPPAVTDQIRGVYPAVSVIHLSIFETTKKEIRKKIETISDSKLFMWLEIQLVDSGNITHIYVNEPYSPVIYLCTKEQRNRSAE